MFGNGRKMVLTENRANQPRYSLLYRREGLTEDAKKLSYTIISRLVKDRDLLIEVDSSLFVSSDPTSKEKVFQELVIKLRQMQLDFRYRKHSSPLKRKIFGLSISLAQTDTEHELFIYVPNRLWVQDGFWELLPEQGATYHILSETTDGLRLLDDIYFGQLLAEELHEHYQITIFDYYSFGRMGIDTGLSKEELEDYLIGL